MRARIRPPRHTERHHSYAAAAAADASSITCYADVLASAPSDAVILPTCGRSALRIRVMPNFRRLHVCESRHAPIFRTTHICESPSPNYLFSHSQKTLQLRYPRELNTPSVASLSTGAPGSIHMGFLGLGRGEPVSFEFSVGLVSLTPWPSTPPVRRLALRWQRGSKVCSLCMHAVPTLRANTSPMRRTQRSGVSRAVHPRPDDKPFLTYEFSDTLLIPATLYKVRPCLQLRSSAWRARGSSCSTRLQTPLSLRDGADAAIRPVSHPELW